MANSTLIADHGGDKYFSENKGTELSPASQNRKIKISVGPYLSQYIGKILWMNERISHELDELQGYVGLGMQKESMCLARIFDCSCAFSICQTFVVADWVEISTA